MGLVPQLEGWGSRLEAERKSRRPDLPDDFLEIGKVEKRIAGLNRDANKFLRKPEFLATRLHRDEHVAHLLKGKSRFGKRLRKQGLEVDPVTYDQIIELSQETVEFISRIVQIWDFAIKIPKDLINISQRHTKLFWNTLPKLSEAESDW